MTNVEVPAVYKKLLEDNGIKIYKYAFDEFLFGKAYQWSLAFYKLCALSHILQDVEYENYMYLDSDVYVQSDVSNIWEECKRNILLYDICHGLQIRDYRGLVKEVGDFLCQDAIGMTHYGGEFFAANKDNAQRFINKCRYVYEEMVKKSFETHYGDEFILSVSAGSELPIRNAGAYIYRYWTGAFRLVSTNYKYNPVSILHVPAEKASGMIKLFDKYVSKGRMPSQEDVWRHLHLDRMPFRLYWYLKIKSIIGNKQ